MRFLSAPCMNKDAVKTSSLLWLVTGLLAGIAMAEVVTAADPKINFIERLGTNHVTVHFEIEPNRSYALQYLDVPAKSRSTSLTNSSTTWSNLVVLPAFPFPNHWIAVDTGTNRNRIYRLSVTP